MAPTLTPRLGEKLTGTAGSVLERKGWGVPSIGPEASVHDAIARMHDLKVGALFVTVDSRLVGVFSERILIRAE